jgi:large subunit ribosomal protein L9
MKIILLKDSKKIGRKYEIKDVADGYALNSLIPAGIAVPATASYIKLIDEKKKLDVNMKEDFKRAFEYGISKLPGGMLHITGKVNEKGHLFASVNTQVIIDAFKKETGIALTEDYFDLKKPIKEVGNHPIEIEVGGEKHKITIAVEATK